MDKYKEIAKKRLRKSKLMKISDLDTCTIRNEQVIIRSFNKKYKPHDRYVKDRGMYNPFDIPLHHRVFSECRKWPRSLKEPFIMSEPQTICDVDPTFYKIIEGRPLRQFSDVKVYMKNIRDITLSRANASYLKDELIQINTSFNFELENYNAINELYLKSKNNFVQFGKESYNTAKQIQELAEKKALELQTVSDRLEGIGFGFVRLRNEMSDLNAVLDTLSMYRKFLYSVSPLPWRELYDEDYPGCTYYFEKFEKHEPKISILSIDDYKKSASKFKHLQPNLFFKKPIQIINMYQGITQQCLNYMHIERFSTSILNSVLKSRDYLKQLARDEIDEMLEITEIYKNQVKWMEEQEVIHKQLFEDMLMTKFYELYASYDSSKLFTCVQYVNTRIFANPEDPRDNLYVLMLELENLYIKLTSELDNLNQEVVKEATKTFFAEDLKMLSQAHLAQRQLRECDILSKALFTSFEPPRPRQRTKKEKGK